MKFFPHSPGDFVAGVKVRKLPMVYVLKAHDCDFVKIGQSKCIKNRLSNIQTACPFSIYLWLGLNSPKHIEIESFLHKKYSNSRYRGEWFYLSSDEEDDLIDFFSATNQNIREASRALL